MEPTGELLSIGDLAAASGVAVGTIRAWERRYGRPVAERLPSGHRRYRAADARWLRRVAEALAKGHRPSEVVRLAPAGLSALLDGGGSDDDESAERWVEYVRRYDARRLGRAMRESFERRGPVAFFDERLAPFLERLGRAWADGTISVRHEHWASQQVDDFLRVRRRGIAATGTPRGRPVVLATFPGERHALGLRMAAAICAARSVRVRWLGADTPEAEISAAARECRARFVAVSVSLATGGVETDRRVADLLERLPSRTTLVVGGAGARGPRRGPRGATYVASMAEFDALLATPSR